MILRAGLLKSCLFKNINGEKMKFKYILFDLDGTLTESGTGILNAIKYALLKKGMEVPEKDILKMFIGPPLSESFKKYCGCTPACANELVGLFREYYVEKGMFENKVYDGIYELLESLKIAGKKLLVATSKPTLHAEKILEHFGLSSFFEYVSGADEDGKTVKKTDIIRNAIKFLDLKDSSCCIMVGDRKYDILGAKTFEIASCGVLYGYGSYEELKNAGADYLCSDTKELLELLLK